MHFTEFYVDTKQCFCPRFYPPLISLKQECLSYLLKRPRFTCNINRNLIECVLRNDLSVFPILVGNGFKRFLSWCPSWFNRAIVKKCSWNWRPLYYVQVSVNLEVFLHITSLITSLISLVEHQHKNRFNAWFYRIFKYVSPDRVLWRHVFWPPQGSQLDLNSRLSLTFRHHFDAFFPTFPDLTTQTRDILSEAMQNIVHETIGFFLFFTQMHANMLRNQGQTLGHFSQIIFPDFPWLSTKNIEILWLSLTFQKEKNPWLSPIFPDAENPVIRI